MPAAATHAPGLLWLGQKKEQMTQLWQVNHVPVGEQRPSYAGTIVNHKMQCNPAAVHTRLPLPKTKLRKAAGAGHDPVLTCTTPRGSLRSHLHSLFESRPRSVLMLSSSWADLWS